MRSEGLALQIGSGTVVADAFDYVEYPKILSQPEADPETMMRVWLVPAVAGPGGSWLGLYVCFRQRCKFFERS